MASASSSESVNMELVGIKVCVIFGLLLLTLIAACLPLILVIPFIGGNSEYIRSSDSSNNLSTVLRRFFPCLTRRRKREGKLSTSTVFSEENEDNVVDEEPSEKRKGGKTKLFMDVMNCFSGGVFLGTSFLALMPEIREIFDDVGIMWPKFYATSSNSTDSAPEEEGTLMPVTEMLVTCGLFFILSLEQVVHSIMERDKHVDKNKNEVLENSHAATERSVIANGEVSDTATIKITAATPICERVDTEAVFNDDLAVDVIVSNGDTRELTDSEIERIHNEHHNDSIVRSLILVATLSIHSLLEGLAIGLQTNASSALSIFVAVLFHKSLMAFSMGNNLVQAGQSVRNTFIAAVVLAMASPIGIATGIVMKETSDGTELVNGILQGLATGTFLFITFFEVLSKEFSNHSHRVCKTIAFILGYCCILAVMFTQHAG